MSALGWPTASGSRDGAWRARSALAAWGRRVRGREADIHSRSMSTSPPPAPPSHPECARLALHCRHTQAKAATCGVDLGRAHLRLHAHHLTHNRRQPHTLPLFWLQQAQL
eukprot:scaffold61414_cov25-Tisochrysis_lutea.AAC.1